MKFKDSGVCKTGLDMVVESRECREWGRIGLLTNKSAISKEGLSSFQALKSAGANITVLFAPEHGINADVADGVEFSDIVHEGIKTVSLFGSSYSPSPENLNDIDSFVIDLQDLGVRFYTFFASLYECMNAVNKFNVENDSSVIFRILDRPLPRWGNRVEGNIPDIAGPFLCPLPVPVLYGLTPGEAALWIKNHFNMALNVEISKLYGWKREMNFEDTGLIWKAPSPAMISADTVSLYAGICFVEGTTLSEGRGTPWPFLWTGAPWLRSKQLAEEISALDIKGLRAYAQPYTPSEGKHAGTMCHGIRYEVDIDLIESPFETGIKLLQHIRHSKSGGFEWVSGKKGLFVDSLWGGEQLRLAVEDKRVDSIIEKCRKSSEEFKAHGGYTNAVIYS